MRRNLLPLLLGIATIPACQPAPAPAPPAATRPGPETAFDELLGLMRKRLAVMHDVARWKWAKGTPIEDPEREAALLDDVAGRGKALGLDPEFTRAFFRAQIEAAKIVQRDDLKRWESEPRARDGQAPPDLAGVLRPRIDALNRDLLAALTRVQSQPRGDDKAAARIGGRADAILTGEGIDPAVRAAAIRPLVARPE